MAAPRYFGRFVLARCPCSRRVLGAARRRGCAPARAGAGQPARTHTMRVAPLTLRAIASSSAPHPLSARRLIPRLTCFFPTSYLLFTTEMYLCLSSLSALPHCRIY
eukprot:1178040-Pleurochrysis_carterae.AAC.4